MTDAAVFPQFEHHPPSRAIEDYCFACIHYNEKQTWVQSHQTLKICTIGRDRSEVVTLVSFRLNLRLPLFDGNAPRHITMDLLVTTLEEYKNAMTLHRIFDSLNNGPYSTAYTQGACIGALTKFLPEDHASTIAPFLTARDGTRLAIACSSAANKATEKRRDKQNKLRL